MSKLRNKLSFKIVLSFVMTAFLAFFLLVWVLQVQLKSNFRNYLQEVQKENLKIMANSISKYYSQKKGWQSITDDPGIWLKTLRESRIQHPGANQQGRMGGRRDNNRGMMRILPNFPDIPKNDRNIKRLPRLLPMDKGLFRNLNLLDKERNLVIGPSLRGDDILTVAIKSGSQEIGYLTLGVAQHPRDRVELQFLENQIKWLYLIATLALIFSAFVSYLLTRHFLAPVALITQGTREIIKRKFENRIDVNSEDELGQLASDFNQMAKTLGHFEKQRKRWLSDIAHELRTPLSVLRGEIEAIIDGVRPRDDHQIKVLLGEVKYLVKLVEDLRELSLADSGEMNFEWEELNPIDIVKESLVNFNLEARQRNLEIISDLGNSDLFIKGDSQKLKQLFSNIITNVISYAAPGTLRVSMESEKNTLQISFRDNGPGVPEEDLPKLFKRLFRVDRSRSRSLGGTGLGLSIAKIIADQHQGKIQAKNIPKGGLEIIIHLPLLNRI